MPGRVALSGLASVPQDASLGSWSAGSSCRPSETEQGHGRPIGAGMHLWTQLSPAGAVVKGKGICNSDRADGRTSQGGEWGTRLSQLSLFSHPA